VVVDRLATAWGVRRDGAGGKVVWCILALPAGTELAAWLTRRRGIDP
jgi:hypothetical protein